jgi:hypothetical protein
MDYNFFLEVMSAPMFFLNFVVYILCVCVILPYHDSPSFYQT